MRAILGLFGALVSVAVVSVYICANAEETVLSLRGTMAFCGKNDICNPNLNAKQWDDIRLAYKCVKPYDLSFIAITYESTPWGGCFVSLRNNKDLCYTWQPHRDGQGETVKAAQCYSFPGQQLWNFIMVGDNNSTFVINPKGRSDLCLTAVHPWHRNKASLTMPLSLEECYTGNDTTLQMRDQWNSECNSWAFRNVSCPMYDPSQLCQVGP